MSTTTTLGMILTTIAIGLWIKRYFSIRLIKRTRRTSTGKNHHGHPLDLPDEFVNECHQHYLERIHGAVRVMSLATYLDSIDQNSEESGHVLCTWVASKIPRLLWPIILPLIPQIKIDLSKESILNKLDYVLGFGNLVTWGFLGDIFHFFLTKHKSSNDKDSVDALISGGCDFGALIPNPLPLEEIDNIIERLLENVPSPDDLVYEHPKPFAQDLFPDLCIGRGGVTLVFTPRQYARNQVISYIFNRLCANGYVGLSIPNATIFSVIDPNDGEIITKPERLVEKYFLTCRIIAHSSSFGFMLCVKEQDGSGYTQIPLVLPTRTGIRDPSSGESIRQLFFHTTYRVSNNSNNKNSPLGEFVCNYYLGPEGLTGFFPGLEFHRPWAEYNYIDTPEFTHQECIKSMKVASAASLAVNLSTRKFDMLKGGYLFHGACTDSVAIIEMAVRGKVSVFPVFSQGDAVSGIIGVIRKDMLPILQDDLLREISDLYAKLPSDLDIRNERILSSIDRMLLSTYDNIHFEYSKSLKQRLIKAREEWSAIIN